MPRTNGHQELQGRGWCSHSGPELRQLVLRGSWRIPDNNGISEVHEQAGKAGCGAVPQRLHDDVAVLQSLPFSIWLDGPFQGVLGIVKHTSVEEEEVREIHF